MRSGVADFQHNFADFVLVFAVYTNASPAHSGGFACLGPENAGETRIFGYRTRNLRVKMGPQTLRQHGPERGMNPFGSADPRAD